MKHESKINLYKEIRNLHYQCDIDRVGINLFFDETTLPEKEKDVKLIYHNVIVKMAAYFNITLKEVDKKMFIEKINNFDEHRIVELSARTSNLEYNQCRNLAQDLAIGTDVWSIRETLAATVNSYMLNPLYTTNGNFQNRSSFCGLNGMYGRFRTLNDFYRKMESFDIKLQKLEAEKKESRYVAIEKIKSEIDRKNAIVLKNNIASSLPREIGMLLSVKNKNNLYHCYPPDENIRMGYITSIEGNSCVINTKVNALFSDTMKDYIEELSTLNTSVVVPSKEETEKTIDLTAIIKGVFSS